MKFRKGTKVQFNAGKGVSHGKISKVDSKAGTATITTHKGGEVIRKLSSLERFSGKKASGQELVIAASPIDVDYSNVETYGSFDPVI